MLAFPAGVRVYVANEPTDMRKSFDGLSAIVQHSFHRDPFDGDVFAFFNRRRDRVKILFWDRNGFWISMKRLERGTFDSWRPKSGDATHVEVERAQLVMLLEGIDLKSAKFRRHYSRSVRINGRDGRSQANGQRRRTG